MAHTQRIAHCAVAALEKLRDGRLGVAQEHARIRAQVLGHVVVPRFHINANQAQTSLDLQNKENCQLGLYIYICIYILKKGIGY